MKEIANSLGLKLSIMCKPYLHAKFIVVDDAIVLSGSVNPTSSGIYYNDEVLYLFTHPTYVKRHMEIFNELWNCPRNTTWERVQCFYGHNGYDNRYSTHRSIARAIIGFFHMNHNEAVSKSSLCEQINKRGFNKDDVIETVKGLLLDGVLYEPKLDMLKLTDYQTSIHDF